MWYYKSFIGNKKVMVSKFLAFFVVSFFHLNAFATVCTKYVISSTESNVEAQSSIITQNQTVSTYNHINEALANRVSGDVICFKAGYYPAIRIENIDGGEHNITLQAELGSLVEIKRSSYSGTGIYIVNSKNITVSGFNISGGLYGIYAKGSSDLTLTQNTITNVGQEAIIVKSAISKQKLTNFIIANNVISHTGKGLSQYGEGIYIGDGNNNYNEFIDNVAIENNFISDTSNEAIDIKINTKNVTVHSNTILNTNLKFNGAITIATSDRYAENSNIIISNNMIEGVVNRSGYRPLGIAIGQGDALIKNNIIKEADERFVGICLFSTFVNAAANTVTLQMNEVTTQGRRLLVNCGSGGTGANALANVVELTE